MSIAAIIGEIPPTSILVFGSLNLDTTFTVPHIPSPGETLHATTQTDSPGGKGANQSHSLALALKLSPSTHASLVLHAGCVGFDDAADVILERLRRVGVDVGFVERVEGCGTGRAVVVVGRDGGENLIVVVEGANGRVDSSVVHRVFDGFDRVVSPPSPSSSSSSSSTHRRRRWLILQNEISNLAEIVDVGRARGHVIVLTAAPISASLTLDVIRGVSYLFMNAHEASAILGVVATTSDDDDDEEEVYVEAVRRVVPGVIGVITLGVRGGLLIHPKFTLRWRAYKPPNGGLVVDTTGAGDTFLGYFVGALVRCGVDVVQGDDDDDCAMLREVHGVAVREGAAAASLCVGRRGAMDAQPSGVEVVEFLNSHSQECLIE